MTPAEIATRYGAIVVELAGETLAPIVLAIIQNESGGAPGIIATQETRYEVPLPSRTGGVILAKHALGLMQVIPANIQRQNRYRDIPIYWEDMTGTSEPAIRLQIESGLQVLKNAIANVETVFHLPVISASGIHADSMAIALASYAYGFSRIAEALRELSARGISATFDNLANYFPDLGAPKNDPIGYAQRVLKKSRSFMGSLPEFQPADFSAIGIGLFLLGIVILGMRGT